ncbi:hypothetical protein L596_022888 [Steinernema carpocapsae]|uniref:C-type lectin domain-containing protein n=1 Tax=Steinernema carpocapsae TaxID=34508 RepID=A0A4U5MBV7_STECR|nr:hypothetical protein L596_022888 [Steinernema carpocapsae]
MRPKLVIRANLAMVLSTLILSILASIALGGDSCPVGSFASFDGKKCLQVVSLETTFQSAQGICASFGGNLASIHNKYDNALIEEHVNENFWLGGSDLSDNDAWKWTDGSKFDYAYWAAGGPSHNSGDDCLLVDKMTGLWQAKPCNTQAFFVCETVVNSCTPSNCPTPKPTTCPSCNCPSQTTPNSYPLGPCPSGAYCNGGYEYRLIGGPKTWSNARSYCKSLGGDMASIHNSDVGSEMYQMLEGNSYNAWLGGQVDANGVLRWIDGSPVDYQSWQQAYPVAYRQLTCALVALEGDVGGWENQNCLDKLSFVCEIPVFSS